MLKIICKDKETRRIVEVSEEEYETNRNKYVDIDDDPGFSIFCWIIGIATLLGIILSL